MTNNTADNFEAIAQDAVELILAIVQGLTSRKDADPSTLLAAVLIADKTEDLCKRAIALGGE